MIHRLALDDHPDAWERAAARAIANDSDAKIEHQWTERDPRFGTESLFLVSSNSMPGMLYGVHYVDEDGERTTSCNCPAGANERVCWHAAAAMLMAGYIVQPLKKLGKDDAPADDTDRKRRIAAAALDVSAIIAGEAVVA